MKSLKVDHAEAQILELTATWMHGGFGEHAHTVGGGAVELSMGAYYDTKCYLVSRASTYTLDPSVYQDPVQDSGLCFHAKLFGKFAQKTTYR